MTVMHSHEAYAFKITLQVCTCRDGWKIRLETAFLSSDSVSECGALMCTSCLRGEEGVRGFKIEVNIRKASPDRPKVCLHKLEQHGLSNMEHGIEYNVVCL